MQGGQQARAVMSTGKKVAAALALNRADWQSLGMVQRGICIGNLALLPAVLLLPAILLLL